jgi:hypothetical protein
MLTRAAFFTAVVIVGAPAAMAAEAIAPGGVYGTDEGCAAVASGNYPDSDDWLVLTGKYMRQHESICSFVQKLPDRYGSIFVNAICSGEGDTWPTSFVIAAGEEEGDVRISDTNNNPWDVHACDGLTDAAADKLFGE